jgi:hypothetical protein
MTGASRWSRSAWIRLPSHRSSVKPEGMASRSSPIRTQKSFRRYGVLHSKAGEDGKDIARPAEFLVDAAGTIRWVNLTDDIRVRARPEAVLEVIKGLGA